MNKPRTHIQCNLDLEKDGKQHGFLNVPYSTNESAYGRIVVPITTLKNGAGPTGLLMAGNHGDEYEGQIALADLQRDLAVAELHGRVIILSAANLPAVLAACRISPLDQGNLNRSFPGNPDGGPTSALAHFIESVLLPKVNYVIDLHSGGRSLMYAPSVLTHFTADGARMARAVEALRAFGAPVGYIVNDVDEGRKLTSAAARAGIIALSTELGGGGTVSRDSLRVTACGIRRVLEYFGNLAASEDESPTPTRVMEVGGEEYYVFSPEEGLFEPAAEIGADVKEGQLAGRVHDPQLPWNEPRVVRFRRSGTVLCRRAITYVRRGDCLYQLGTDYHG